MPEDQLDNSAQNKGNVSRSFSVKGFNLSKDYQLLWKLIQAGYRVPAWLIYSDKYKEPIWDLVEVKKLYKSEHYSIGTRGIGYADSENNLEQFIENCEYYDLHFVLPENLE